MPESHPPSLDDLPKGPGLRILRARQPGAWRDAYRFLAEARAAADDIEQSARGICAAEQARGHREGRAAGANESARLVSETVGKVDRYLASLEQDVADIALAIVRRVLGEFDVAELIARATAQTLDEFRHEKWLKITVHPDIVERVHAILAPLLRDTGPTLTVEGDQGLDRTSCTVATEFAVVDASIETQLEAIATALARGPGER
jgi:type III secretion protein L